ncbi:uncharacterized protein [Penaeus vannamei]|uniref:Uncharacterized protein n=1 Tax=Penaeus vannamei TaxID=6689 RepID=A0A423SRW1_PENVA|nr:uncharacterized protein LOC113818138 [Penaeus vannamei]ROT66938.1 hypothetical protein C7M84_014992 [Penaeus vannamei]
MVPAMKFHCLVAAIAIAITRVVQAGDTDKIQVYRLPVVTHDEYDADLVIVDVEEVLVSTTTLTTTIEVSKLHETVVTKDVTEMTTIFHTTPTSTLFTDIFTASTWDTCFSTTTHCYTVYQTITQSVTPVSIIYPGHTRTVTQSHYYLATATTTMSKYCPMPTW